MLTKPQAFLREVANLCFKNFCVNSLDTEALVRLLTIVSTPNLQAGEFMQGGQEAEEEGSEEGDLVDESEDSDLMEWDILMLTLNQYSNLIKQLSSTI